jgi:hypothetical protein
MTATPCALNLAAAANGGTIAGYSSNFGGNWDVARLIDGSLTAGWSGASGQTTNQYIIVRLPAGNTYTIDHVQIDPAATSGDPSIYDMRDFQIRVSTTNTDTLSFTTVYTGTTPQQNALFRYDFAPVQARYVMLFILNNYNGNAGYTEAAEFEVYSACAPSTSTPTITATPTITNTPQARIVGHVTWQGRPAQPNALEQLPITLTLRSGTTEVNYPLQTTDASGFFTVSVSGLPNGTYNWRVKGPDGVLKSLATDPPGFLANAGPLTLAGAAATQVEMGLMKAGDANNDNLVSAQDFSIMKNTFGKSTGNPGYDNRADFNGDTTVSVQDFNLLKGTFGTSGAPPTGP